MRRSLLAAALLCALTAPPAGADLLVPEEIGYNDGETGFLLARVSDVQASISVTGDCSFVAASDPTPDDLLGGPDTYTGLVDAHVLVYSDDPAANPVSATVTCELLVNAVPQYRTSGSGTGLVVVADVLTYEAEDGDVVTLCTVVDYAGGGHDVRCGGASSEPIVPEPVVDSLNHVLDDVLSLTQAADPLVCPVLAGLPGDYGEVAVDEEGDVFVLGVLFWDCPPYEGSASRAAVAPTEAHDVVAGCSFKVSRRTGQVAVAGRAHAGRHPTATSTRIRCRLVDAVTGAVVYDQERIENGALARLEDVVLAVPNAVTVCTEATGWWTDAHQLPLPMTCRAP
jgi:hypothetical protein